jgi:hypothetical protein
MNGTWEANNVGPGGSQNRSVALQRTAQTLPAVFFNNLSSVPIPTALTFQVDMTVQTALGNFNPATDFVEAQGTFNNWTAGFTLMNTPENTNIYSGTWVDTIDAQGSTVQYQFVLNNGSGANWETAVGNRQYSLTSTNDQTLPLVYFNNMSNLGPLSMQRLSGSQASIAWTAGPLIRLQTSSSLSGAAWQDVPNTLGSNSVTVSIGPAQTFFRLKAP